MHERQHDGLVFGIAQEADALAAETLEDPGNFDACFVSARCLRIRDRHLTSFLICPTTQNPAGQVPC